MDVGEKQYGDCILCLAGDQSILIDGAHRGDDTLIRDQIQHILGRLTIDLLVVTHCHADHIGCLPTLVTGGQLRCGWALLADPEFGYGLAVLPGTDGADALRTSRLFPALREEPIRDSSDDEVAWLIEDALRQRDEYEHLIKHLRREIGERLVLLRGSGPGETDGLGDLEAAFADSGFRTLGPTRHQLELCAAQMVARAVAITSQESSVDSIETLVAGYRRICDGGNLVHGETVADDGTIGAAINNQSLVIACGSGASRILLTGDMQLAQRVTGGLASQMKDLRERIAQSGPYSFVKLPHHGSSNGADSALLKQWKASDVGITTGRRSRSHPAPNVLALLEQLGYRHVRTDKHGRCGWESATPALFEEGSAESRVQSPVMSVLNAPATWKEGPLAKGRPLPRLLFVTNRSLLEMRVGAFGAGAVGEMLSGHLTSTSDLNEVRRLLGDDPSIRGVVIIGGPSVVPHLNVDLLSDWGMPESMRNRDSDEWRVFSDAAYGHRANGEGTLPVSRIPDGDDPSFLIRALQVAGPPAKVRGTGIRNLKRPFADWVFKEGLQETAPLLRSSPVEFDQNPPYDMLGELNYLMLHMDEDDGSYGYGESFDFRRSRDAIRLQNIPGPSPSVVVCGACWGALTTEYPYRHYWATGHEVSARRTERSIAMTCLSRGANAFIGCLGSHYSPVNEAADDDYRWMAGPLHLALMKALRSGLPPAQALWEARTQYSVGIPFRKGHDLFERKVSEVFTCLGLGW